MSRKTPPVIAKKMTTEEINSKRDWYLNRGWYAVRGPLTLGFVSPCGEWFHCFDVYTGNMFSFDTNWPMEVARNRGKYLDEEQNNSSE